MCQMELVLVTAVVWSALASQVHGAQSTVFVKFLSPPHGYSHDLQLGPNGAISKEDRIYPGDTRPFGMHDPRYQGGPPVATGYHGPNRYRGPGQYQGPGRYQPPSPPSPPSPGYFYQTPGGAPTFQQDTSGYSYPKPPRPFDEYGPPPLFQNDSPPAEPYLPDGEYYNPRTTTSQAEVMYDPHLITGPQAAEYVRYLFGRGELFFHLIPHERLVLMNQRERADNNLVPHLLASIRPGHPFFLH